MGMSLINDIIHEDSHEVVEAILARALQGEDDINAEVKLLKFSKNEPNSVVYLLANACTSRDYKDDIIGVCFVGQDVTAEKTAMDKFVRLKRDYKAIVESPNPLMPPIFASDSNARCSEWNAAMEKLTGWNRHEVIGKLLPGEIFGSLCWFKGQEINFMVLLYCAIGGRNIQKQAFGFFDRRGKFVESYLMANRRVDEVENVVGCLCFLQVVVTDQQQSIENKKELAYIKRETQSPLSGICFTHKLLEGSSISDDQKQFLETSDACERQILSVIENINFGSLDEREIEINVTEFILGNVANVVISQSLIPSKEKNLQLIHDIPDKIMNIRLHGDQMKLQLALSDFYRSIVDYAPSPDGWVEFKVSQGPKLITNEHEFVQLQFRVFHPQSLKTCLVSKTSRQLMKESRCTFLGNLSI